MIISLSKLLNEKYEAKTALEGFRDRNLPLLSQAEEISDEAENEVIDEDKVISRYPESVRDYNQLFLETRAIVQAVFSDDQEWNKLRVHINAVEEYTEEVQEYR